MRVRALSLEYFGHFSGQGFDFGKPGDAPDFHIVHGSNEAGKTTTMEGFLRLLYGFPHREPYDFRHQRKNLRVSGVLELDGGPRSFTRLPQRSGNLLDEAGRALPEQAIAACLGGLSLDDYRSLLCLDDETIERGGEAIANAEGDIGRLLFSAAAGIGDLTAVLEQTRAEAEALYRKRASKTEMAQLKAQLKEVEAAIRDHDTSVPAWRRLKEALDQAETDEAAARSERDRLRLREAALAALPRALPLLQEHDARALELAERPACPEQLDVSPEDLVQLQSAAATAAADLDRLDREITAATEAREALALDPAHAALAEPLAALDDLRSRMRTAALDLPKRRRELAEAQADMATLAAQLHVAPDVDPTALVLPPSDIAALEAAREDLRRAEEAQAAEAREIAALTERIARDTAALEARTEEAPATTGIAQILTRFDADTLGPEEAAAQQAIAAAKERLVEALDALARGARVFDTLPDPAMEADTAHQLAETHAALSEARREAAQQRDTHLERRDAQTARIAALEHALGQASDAEAEAARDRRDALWSAHRAALTGDSAETYWEAQTRLDETGELRLGRAQDLAQLRQRAQDAAEEGALADRAAARVTALTEEITAIEARIAEAVEPLGLASLTPGDFARWLDRHAEAAEARRRLDRTRAAQAPVLARAEALLAALRPHLDREDPGFASALGAARALARQEQAREDALRDATRAVIERRRELATRQARLDTLTTARCHAQQGWENRVADALGQAVTPDRLGPALSLLRDLREKNTARAEAARRVEAMQADQAQFAREIAALADPLGLPCDDPMACCDQLQHLAQAAQTAASEHDTLGRRIATMQEARDAARHRQDEIARQARALAATLPDMTGNETLDEIRQAVMQASDTLARRAELRRLELRLLAELDAPDLDTARDRLSESSTAALEAEAATLTSDLEAAETRLSEATATRATAARDLDAISGDAEIALLVEQRATLELQMEQVALDYLDRAIGLSLAEDAIRRYRDAHRSGMMQATERAFAELTQGAYATLRSEPDGASERLVAVDAAGVAKGVQDLSKGTRFQLYLALRAAAYQQLVAEGIRLPFFCDDIFETFDEERTRAACRLMEQIGRSGQAIYLTHHRHVVEIAQEVCETPPRVHQLGRA
ncbi:ATP-binding protein [Pseudoponticoccus marisrubri]|uniref:YhaN AAA domain-containing protein n=1 Tax=Pseudoponticoccus marisrubri TaxID=1685382 RepID=A0A0W7WLE4_9RHOB|nr:YhaN family protein [Pseudoponticoccus marisrubri]KUF11359.1 hypothetical protein AVJ23_06210 [Pseudoponticoccus marisrubri]